MSQRSQNAPTPEPQVLVVDDDHDHLALVQRWLELANYRVTTAANGRDALARIAQTRPDLVITDLFMDNMDGLRLLSEIHAEDPVMPVMILSGRAAIPDAVKATHLGVSAFLTKPIQRQNLLDEINHVLQDNTGGKPKSSDDFAPRMVHRSSLMQELLGRARRVAVGESTVMISGETGTGKELLARAIHDGSRRHDESFVSINCSALPEQLLESELFGHEKGAFTGALTKHEGLFQTADKGTLFLDEIGDMPMALQAKLLRVLQDFHVRPVGATKSVPVDVRVVSATHPKLDQSVAAGEFREDLYYRLNVVPLRLPALRDRREDIPLLIEAFLDEFAKREGGDRKRFAPNAMSHLISARYPGNVRQLRNVVEQCVVLSTSSVIPLSLTSEALRDQPGDIMPLDEAKLAFERRYLASVLRASEGKVVQAARLAGRNRTEFYKLLQRHELDPSAFRATGKASASNDKQTP